MNADRAPIPTPSLPLKAWMEAGDRLKQFWGQRRHQNLAEAFAQAELQAEGLVWTGLEIPSSPSQELCSWLANDLLPEFDREDQLCAQLKEARSRGQYSFLLCVSRPIYAEFKRLDSGSIIGLDRSGRFDRKVISSPSFEGCLEQAIAWQAKQFETEASYFFSTNL